MQLCAQQMPGDTRVHNKILAFEEKFTTGKDKVTWLLLPNEERLEN